MKYIYLILACLFFSGCAQTSVLMLETSAYYSPTSSVDIIGEPPKRPYKKIAMLESTGPVNTPMTKLLESMRQKAMTIGADAVMPVQDASYQQQQGVIYNPWLGGYQTTAGGTVPKIRGIAIKYSE
ncbi:hypothetical protein [Microbulbifer thermotolerans]|nr:hypothetical protein [Microbulbifer thermotolerans]